MGVCGGVCVCEGTGVPNFACVCVLGEGGTWRKCVSCYAHKDRAMSKGEIKRRREASDRCGGEMAKHGGLCLQPQG